MQLFWNGLVEAVKMIVSGDPLVLSAAWLSLWVSCLAVALAGVFGIGIGSLLARKRFPGNRTMVVLFRVGMAIPTVLIGLLCYGLFSRRGPLGGFELLFTPWAIVIGEFLLALPIVVTLTHGAIRSLDPRVSETARTLGAGAWQRWLTYASEARVSLLLALLTAFARCFTELGIAMMVGGNLAYRTRTLTTATTLETARGEFARGVAMSLILLAIALLVTFISSSVAHEEPDA